MLVGRQSAVLDRSDADQCSTHVHDAVFVLCALAPVSSYRRAITGWNEFRNSRLRGSSAKSHSWVPDCLD